jgi:hypothetical protein
LENRKSVLGSRHRKGFSANDEGARRDREAAGRNREGVAEDLKGLRRIRDSEWEKLFPARWAAFPVELKCEGANRIRHPKRQNV